MIIMRLIWTSLISSSLRDLSARTSQEREASFSYTLFMSWIKLKPRKKKIKFLTCWLNLSFLRHQRGQWELFHSAWTLIFVNQESPTMQSFKQLREKYWWYLSTAINENYQNSLIFQYSPVPNNSPPTSPINICLFLLDPSISFVDPSHPPPVPAYPLSLISQIFQRF